MNATSNEARDIFLEAIEIPSPHDRADFLERACAGDADLRGRVERLIRSHEQLGTFHESSEESGPIVDRPLAECSGTLIGPFKLLQQIGDGGMGVVFMAEQEKPVQRTVALKIIKPGMDTRQVIARFEAERQALALMDHPNIARVLDAGTTDTGRPYFVMDLVKGIPITEYCDRQQLSIRERLELMSQVCQAVQHAHQKGIIHRDIKPSNVLVAEYDGKPVPKIIDFGVAKATAQKLTEKTLFTEYGQLIGTFEYMSPEQARFNQLDVDTRSDIYSLGVLLYELLVGSTPLERERLRNAAFDEMLRIIREEEPPKPSTRLTSSDALPSIATNRGLEPLKLNRLVEGELDWIVMKCLEKDRNRRYATASGFAADIARHLKDEPVEACPPSAAYRFRKYARRHKLAIGVVGLVTTLLVAAIVLLTATNARIRRESAAKALALKDKDAAIATARQAVYQMLTRVGNEDLRNVPLADPLRYSLLEDALRFTEGFLQQADPDASTRLEAARVFAHISSIQREMGRNEDALKAQQRSLELLESLVASDPDEPMYREILASAHAFSAFTISVSTDKNRSAIEDHLRLSLRMFDELERDFPDRPPASAGAKKLLGDYIISRDPVESEQLYRQSIAQVESQIVHSTDPGQWTQLGWSRFALATHSSVRPTEAEELFQQAIEAVDRALELDPQQRSVKFARGHLIKGMGDFYEESGRKDEAIPLYRQSLDEFQLLVKQNPWTPAHWLKVREAQVALVVTLHLLGRIEDAKTALAQCRAWAQEASIIMPDDPEPRRELRIAQSQIVDLFRLVGDPNTANELEQALPASKEVTATVALRNDDERLASSLDNLGQALSMQWEVPEAEEMHRNALAIWRKQRGEKNPLMVRSLRLLADSLRKQSKMTEAVTLIEEAGIEPADAGLINSAAWLLATDPDSARRDPQRAVQLAQQAVELAPQVGGIWNTLGVAEYRAGNWNAAIKALEKSMDLMEGGNVFNWFFLAMAQWQLGEKDEARIEYDKAVEWMDKNAPQNEELRGFRAEVEELLKITDEKPTTSPIEAK